jgi:hypothetical protein
MRLLWIAAVAALGVGLVVTSVGWYLSAHPGGTRFESCQWNGDQLVLSYSYGTGDKVSTMVNPRTDDVVAQFRVQEASGSRSGPTLVGETKVAVAGGPRPVHYPNGAELSCATR